MSGIQVERTDCGKVFFFVVSSAGYFQDSVVVHDLDIMVWIVGEYPNKVAVTATGNVPEIRELGDYDTAVIVLTFPSGTISVTDLSKSSSYGKVRWERYYG